MTLLNVVIERLKRARKVAIFTHQRPDPDALGSQAAAAWLLKGLGAVEIHCVQFVPVSGPYRFLAEDVPGGGGGAPVWDAALGERLAEVDTILLVDTCTYQQLEPAEGFLKAQREKVVAVDHHLSRDDVGTVLFTDTEAAACVEIIWEMAKQTQTAVDATMALPLMAGLVGDTGWFRFDSVKPRTHRMAADLVRLINPATLYERLMQNETKSKLGLMQRALGSLRWSAGERFACMCLSQKDFAETGAVQSQTEYLVDMPMMVGTVEVVALMTETEDGRVRASLRSKHGVDVNKVCRRFAGGGHAKAAGCRLEGPMEGAYQRLRGAVEEALEL